MEMFFALLTPALFGSMLRTSTPVLFGALAYTLSARAGITDMGIEGKLLFGAFAGAFMTELTGSPLLGALFAMVVTAVVNWLIGLILVKLRAQQVIVGIGLNFFMTGLTTVLLATVWKQPSNSPSFQRMRSPLASALMRLPGVGEIFEMQTPTLFLAWAAAIVMFVVTFRTRVGLRLRAVGENPRTADSLGINVHRYQLLSMLLGGMLCGLGGADLSVGQLGFFAKEMIAGRGFVALACASVGRFHPLTVVAVTLMVSLVDALQVRLQGAYEVPVQFFQIIPYIAPIIVLCCFGGTRAPAAMGKPFKRGER